MILNRPQAKICLQGPTGAPARAPVVPRARVHLRARVWRSNTRATRNRIARCVSMPRRGDGRRARVQSRTRTPRARPSVRSHVRP